MSVTSLVDAEDPETAEITRGRRHAIWRPGKRQLRVLVFGWEVTFVKCHQTSSGEGSQGLAVEETKGDLMGILCRRNHTSERGG